MHVCMCIMCALRMGSHFVQGEMLVNYTRLSGLLCVYTAAAPG